MRSLLNLAPFVFSTELARAEGVAAAMLGPTNKGVGLFLYLHEIQTKIIYSSVLS